jgi:predicted nucleic acid-binding protein
VRVTCEERDVPFTGTVGILKGCVRDGMLLADEADAVLRSMIEAGYFSPVRRISDLV